MVSGARWVSLVTIRNMNRAIRFYTKSLGGKMGDRGRGAMRNAWASVKVGGQEVWLIAPPKWERRSLAYSTLLVKNIKRAVSAFAKRGVKFQKAERMGPTSRIEGPITYESFGSAAFFKDTEGNLLMLWQNVPAM